MSLFTRQRILCNGIAQRDFTEVWPGLERARRPSETLLAGLFAPKLFELRELVSALAVTQERKVVVFSQWRRMLRLAARAVSDVLGDQRLRAVFFTGEESQRRRTQKLVDFHDDPGARPVRHRRRRGRPQPQRAARSCINLDLPWSPAVLEQRIGRIYRLGQRRPIDVYNLVAESGIEGRIAALVGDRAPPILGPPRRTRSARSSARSGSSGWPTAGSRSTRRPTPRPCWPSCCGRWLLASPPTDPVRHRSCDPGRITRPPVLRALEPAQPRSSARRRA
jgi:hypothetical protein